LNEERFGGSAQLVLGDLPGIRVHVDGLLGADPQVLFEDGLRLCLTLLPRRQGAVTLARHPEVDVLMAKLLLQKFLFTPIKKRKYFNFIPFILTTSISSLD